MDAINTERHMAVWVIGCLLATSCGDRAAETTSAGITNLGSKGHTKDVSDNAGSWFDDLNERQLSNALLIATLGTAKPYVGATELGCAQADHDAYIRQAAAGGTPAEISELTSRCTVKASELQRVVDDLSACEGGPVTHAITVLHGLDQNFQFVPALQVQCLTYDAATQRYTLPSSTDIHIINANGTLTPVANGLTAWNNAGGEGHRYRERLHVSNTPGVGFRRFDQERDATGVVFPYESTIAQLIAQNSLMTNGSLQIVQIAVATAVANQDIKARTAWVPANVTLNDHHHTNLPFRAKAADLGSPCPPSCPGTAFAFRTAGTAPRPGCH